MKKRLVAVFAIVLFACCIIATGTALADNVIPAGLINSGTAVSGVLSGSGTVIGTFYDYTYHNGTSGYSNYTLTFTYNNTTFTENAFCVDPGGGETAKDYYINTPSNVASSSTTPSLQQYEEAAWIANQYYTNAAGVTKTLAQAAIWETVFGTDVTPFTNGTYNSSSTAFVYNGTGSNLTTVNNLVTDAATAYNNGAIDMNGYYLGLSPADSVSGSYGFNDQDALFGGTPTPEPATLFLYGALLMGLGFLRRYHWKAKA